MESTKVYFAKGDIIAWDGIWYVIVEIAYNRRTGDLDLYCICDHANNIHSINADDIEVHVPLSKIYDYVPVKNKREIPHDVIKEVLAGDHDGRFDHWKDTNTMTIQFPREDQPGDKW